METCSSKLLHKCKKERGKRERKKERKTGKERENEEKRHAPENHCTGHISINEYRKFLEKNNRSSNLYIVRGLVRQKEREYE